MSKETAPQMSMSELLLHKIPVPPELKGWVLRRGLEKILLTTTYVYPPDFPERIQEAALLGPFTVAQNHARNSDIPPGARVAAKIARIVNRTAPENRKIRGFVEPYALSLKTGTQGEMSTFYSDVLPLLRRFGVEAVPTSTASDLEKGRITQEEFEEYRSKSSKRMLEAVAREQKSILIAPEASVKGGTINPETGIIFGMQRFVPGALHQALRTLIWKNDYGTIVPVGISGGCNVLDSLNNKITNDAVIVGLGISSRSLMVVRVGEPIIFTKKQIKALDPDLLDFQIGTAIAHLVNPEERGTVYGIAA